MKIANCLRFEIISIIYYNYYDFIYVTIICNQLIV